MRAHTAALYHAECVYLFHLVRKLFIAAPSMNFIHHIFLLSQSKNETFYILSNWTTQTCKLCEFSKRVSKHLDIHLFFVTIDIPYGPNGKSMTRT